MAKSSTRRVTIYNGKEVEASMKNETEMNVNNVHYSYGTSVNANINVVGKVILQEDASGWQKFEYGKLGEVTGNLRTFALPYEQYPYTFAMRFEYDSWKICASRMKRKLVFFSEAQPNLREVNFRHMDRPVLYASPYLVSGQGGYTKHYYADNERIASKIGGGGLSVWLSVTTWTRCLTWR